MSVSKRGSSEPFRAVSEIDIQKGYEADMQAAMTTT
jgi:hypothetical protein